MTTIQAKPIIDGTAVDVTPIPDEPRALAVVPAQPGQALVADVSEGGPEAMLTRATAIATALSKMVEAQKLYTTISNKKYPHVEAWMTIGRMDNVVAREVVDGIVRHEDGSYEATVELVRLSDGMVIGRASAVCGMPDDRPWDKRAEYARRSMAVTRATSRAFRAQYSWIMALAGYQPTPADEMPHEPDAPVQRPETTDDGGLIGTVTKGSAPVDMETRQTPEDEPAWGFKLIVGRKGYQALAIGPLAERLPGVVLVGAEVTVWGPVTLMPWDKDGKKMPPYSRIAIERIATAAGVFEAPPPPPVEAESVPLPFDMDAVDREAVSA